MTEYDRAFDAAKTLLQHAAQLDRDKRYMEARLCYQEGAGILMDAIRNIPIANGDSVSGDANETKRNDLRNKVSQYLNRAEALKRLVDQQKATGQYSETIKIENGACSFSYDKVFRRFLDSTITDVEIEDAYIQQPYQVQNLCRFCELLVKHCSSLQTVMLLTTQRAPIANEPSWHQQQQVSLNNLARSLSDSHNVKLIVSYSKVLHDREIRFSNGWVIKPGRGLDYFQPPANNMAIGAYDYDFRPCKETTIHIYHKAFNKTLS